MGFCYSDLVRLLDFYFFSIKYRGLTLELILIQCLDCRWKEEDRNKWDGQDALLKGISAGEEILVALRYTRQGGIHCHGTLCHLGWHKIQLTLVDLLYSTTIHRGYKVLGHRDISMNWKHLGENFPWPAYFIHPVQEFCTVLWSWHLWITHAD